jgi:hypothetical protein
VPKRCFTTLTRRFQYQSPGPLSGHFHQGLLRLPVAYNLGHRHQCTASWPEGDSRHQSKQHLAHLAPQGYLYYYSWSSIPIQRKMAQHQYCQCLPAKHPEHCCRLLWRDYFLSERYRYGFIFVRDFCRFFMFFLRGF